jgi:hypothetical protein
VRPDLRGPGWLWDVLFSIGLLAENDFYSGAFPSDLSTFINERFKFDLTWDDVA